MIWQASHSDIQGAAPQISDLSRGIPAYGRDKFASGKFTSPNAHWPSKGQPMLVRGSAPKTLGPTNNAMPFSKIKTNLLLIISEIQCIIHGKGVIDDYDVFIWEGLS